MVFSLEKLSILEVSLLNKKELRQKFSLIIKQLSKARRKQASDDACKHLTHLVNHVTSVASFAPFGNEIDIWPFNIEMIKQKKLLLPKVSGKDLNFYKVADLSELCPSHWNILEPSSAKSNLVKTEEIELIIVPGLAYDKQHQRLGMGKGFYDRFLSLNNSVKSIGVGFLEQQFTESLPLEPHDQALKNILLF